MRSVASAIGSVVKATTAAHLLAVALVSSIPTLHAADLVVTSAADAGAGSLREALGTFASGDVIVFDIPGAAPVINLATPLPQLSGDASFRNDGAVPVVIDRNGTAAWELVGGTIDPTELNIVDGGAPSADADLVTNTDTTIIGNAIFSGNLTSPGTISPGATAGSIGTLGVTGDLNASNSTVAIGVDSTGAGESDRITVGGTTTLTDATLQPVFTGESFVLGQSFTVLDSGAIVGAFTNAADVYELPNQPFLEVVQDLALPASQFGLLVQDNGITFESLVTGCNQTSSAILLDELLALGTVPAVGALRSGSGETVGMAIEQLSGSIYPSLIGAEINHIQNNVASVRDRVALHGVREGKAFEKLIWARGYGAGGRVDRDACETAGYEQVIGGVELGAGVRGSNGLSLVVFSHIGDSKVESTGVDQQADISSYRIGGMVEYQGRRFYAIAAGGAGTQDYEVRRSLDVFDGSTFAESTFNGASKFGYFEFGTAYHEENVIWGPYLGLNASRVELDPVSETGDANLALRTSGGFGESYRSVVGVSFMQSQETRMGTATTRVRAGWMHEFGNQSETFVSRLATPTLNSLVDRGVAGGRDWGFVRLQVDMGYFLGGQITGSYLGQYNTRSVMNTGLAGINWAF